MNYLILINNAPLMAEYHSALGDALKAKGNNVFYAATDSFCIRDVKFNDKFYDFSRFFKKNYSISKIDDQYRDLNCWEAFFSDYDRNVVNYKLSPYTNSYYEALFANLITFFDNIITENSIDFIVYENISNSFAYFAFLVGEKNGAKYLGYLPSRLPGRFELQMEIHNIVNSFSEEFDKIDSYSIEDQYVIDYLRKYENDIPSYHQRNHPLSYDYPFQKVFLSKKKFILFFNSLKYSFKNKNDYKYFYQLGNTLKLYRNLFLRQVKRRLRISSINNLFDKVSYEENYFVFPLQFKPESSTSVWAKDFTNDINLITNICSNLPVGTFLYVKEHFVNLGLPELKFYKSLKAIPNLKLLHPNEPNRALLKNSKGVITITSTMGFEALLMGKRVLTFGNIFYQKHPNCYKAENFKDLFAIFQKMLNFEEIAPLDDINKKFVKAYYNISYEGDIDYVAYEKFEPNRFSSVIINAIEQKLQHREDSNINEIS